MDKQSLRKNILQKRKNYDSEILREYTLSIMDKLLNYDNFKIAKHVGLYYPIHHEVDTLEFINIALSLQKKVYLPKVDGDSMDFYEISSLDDLEIGTFNVYEPKSNKKIDKKDLDVIFIPLVAFNKDKYRIGYGKGYYDKYLKDYLGPTLGLGYSFQQVEFIPDHYDVALTKIVTDSYVIA